MGKSLWVRVSERKLNLVDMTAEQWDTAGWLCYAPHPDGPRYRRLNGPDREGVLALFLINREKGGFIPLLCNALTEDHAKAGMWMGAVLPFDIRTLAEANLLAELLADGVSGLVEQLPGING